MDGPTPAGRVTERLGISKATLSRMVRATPDAVLRIGRSVATRYALPREVRTFGSRWPVYRVDASGQAHHAADLHALAPRSWWYEAQGARSDWLVGEFRDGLFPDLPWFLDDLRPQGFVGRAFARRHADELGLSNDPRLWDAAGVLVSLLLYGDDLPGNFVVGDSALERTQRASLAPPSSIPERERPDRYSEIAAAALAGASVGSSAGGEQPKFATRVDASGELRHVLVKFSPLRDTPGGRRWADLLVCEHLAAQVLRENGVPSCSTALVEGGGRTYLEVVRFDRTGVWGREGYVTLFPLEAAHYGMHDNWAAAADRLERDGWLDREGASRLRLLWHFGNLIGNTDMHFANVSITLDSLPARLAPAYDTLPMAYRPEAGGEVIARSLEPPLPTPIQLPAWRTAAPIAEQFWSAVSKDSRVSDEFRSEAERNAAVVRVLLQRFG